MAPLLPLPGESQIKQTEFRILLAATRLSDGRLIGSRPSFQLISSFTDLNLGRDARCN